MGAHAGRIQRTSIESIRDAFLGVAVKMLEDTAAAHVARSHREFVQAAPAPRPDPGLSQAALRAGDFSCFTVACLHVHDEASLRLRSSANTDAAAPGRSRKSSVQQHAISLFSSPGDGHPLPVELDALNDKSAITLATALERAVRSAAAVARRGVPADAVIFFSHILVGDGVQTNAAAARILRVRFDQAPIAPNLRYLVMVVQCANHQANLVIRSSVEQRGATEAALQLQAAARAPLAAPADFPAARKACRAKSEPHLQASGHIVRIFKYLLNDYHSEFYGALVAHVSTLRFVLRSDMDQAALRLATDGDAKSVQLEQLYGEDVLQPGVRAVLNGGFDRWWHIVPTAHEEGYHQSPASYQAAVRAKLVEVIRSHYLTVDEHPTYTRMFTFTHNVNKVLGLIMFGLMDKVFRLTTVEPQAKNKARLTKVLAFAKQPQALQYLKRTSLALQLSHHTHSICAKLHTQADPPLVQLAKGKVRLSVIADFKRMPALLRNDADLNYTAAATVLVGVVIDTVSRFRQYELYPFKLCMLSSAYNDHYLVACGDFLRTPDEELDIGFSLQLKQQALSWGSEAAGMDFLCGRSVQALLRSTFSASCATSLPAERKFAEAKHSEALGGVCDRFWGPGSSSAIARERRMKPKP